MKKELANYLNEETEKLKSRQRAKRNMSKQIKPISQQKYFKHSTTVCPLCMSFDITSDSVEMDGNTGSAEVFCNTCGSSWKDVVKVTRYINLNEGESKDAIDEIMEKAREHKESIFC